MPETDEERRIRCREYVRRKRADPQFREAENQRQTDRRRQGDSPHWRKFGGTKELFVKYWKQQRGRCGICNRRLRPWQRSSQPYPVAQFDHCHSTLRPRGILCSSCNGNLGWYEMYKEEIEEYLCP